MTLETSLPVGSVLERYGYGDAEYHGTAYEYVGVRDSLNPPAIYHRYQPNGAAWNWEVRCGRDLASHYLKSRAVRDGARPCKQCYRDGDA